MKRFFTTILFVGLVLTSFSQKTFVKADIFNGYGNPLTAITLQSDADSKYYIEYFLEDGTETAKLCIGTSKSEAKETLRKILLFVEDDDMVSLLLSNGHTTVSLFKEGERIIDENGRNPKVENYMSSYAYDNENRRIYLPKEFIRMAINRI